MKRHSWSGTQCARCGLTYYRRTNEVLFPFASWKVPLLEQKIPRCGESGSLWRARMALKAKRLDGARANNLEDESVAEKEAGRCGGARDAAPVRERRCARCGRLRDSFIHGKPWGLTLWVGSAGVPCLSTHKYSSRPNVYSEAHGRTDDIPCEAEIAQLKAGVQDDYKALWEADQAQLSEAAARIEALLHQIHTMAGEAIESAPTMETDSDTCMGMVVETIRGLRAKIESLEKSWTAEQAAMDAGWHWFCQIQDLVQEASRAIPKGRLPAPAPTHSKVKP